MAFYGRPSLPFARPRTLQTLQTPKTPQRPLQWLLIGFQRPHPWLLMGVQACRLPGLEPSKPSKPLKPLQGHFNGFFWASSAGKSPHPWLFMGVQACRLPSLKNPPNPSNPYKATSMASYGLPSQAKAHIHGFLWASKLAVCQAQNPPNPPNP